MKKSIRILAMLLMVVLVFSTMMPAYAQSADPSETRATIKADCGLTKKSDSTYKMWGSFVYTTNANLLISVKLYSSGSSSPISTCSKSAFDSDITVWKTVSISSGTYTVHVEGYANGVLVCQNNRTVSIP